MKLKNLEVDRSKEPSLWTTIFLNQKPGLFKDEMRLVRGLLRFYNEPEPKYQIIHRYQSGGMRLLGSRNLSSNDLDGDG
jgi:hypothetical protein